MIELVITLATILGGVAMTHWLIEQELIRQRGQPPARWYAPFLAALPSIALANALLLGLSILLSLLVSTWPG